MTDAPELGEETPTFEAPWQARGFALAVALTDEREGETLTWDEFQSRLVAEVDADREDRDADDADRKHGDGEDADPEAVYYRQWLAALEGLLVDRDVLDPGELLDRIEDFETGNRDAHEFVAGDPHAHADGLPDGHAEGSHHDHGDEHDHEH